MAKRRSVYLTSRTDLWEEQGLVVRVDGENAVYLDTGCAPELPSCLECPLEVCKYDDPEALVRWQETRRVAVAVERLKGLEGLTGLAAAAKLGVTQRTIWRYKGRARAALAQPS